MTQEGPLEHDPIHTPTYRAFLEMHIHALESQLEATGEWPDEMPKDQIPAGFYGLSGGES